MDGDDFVEDADFIDTEEEVGSNLILGYPATNVKAGGTLFFVLFLVISLVSSSIGFYQGVGQLSLEIIPFGSNNPDDFGTLDEELEFKVYISAPTLGWLSADQVDYEISYDGKVRATGSFEYDEPRSGEGSKVKVEINNFFVDNGDYEVTVTAGGNSDSDTIFVARNGQFVEGVMNYNGGSYDDASYNLAGIDSPEITLRFTSDSTDSLAPRVSPQGFGYMDIFYTEHSCTSDHTDNCDTHPNDEYHSCYWNDNEPSCGPNRPSNWDNNDNLAQRIYFNISRDAYSWNADGDADDLYSGVGELYTIELVADDLRRNQDSDFSIKIYFTNTFTDGFENELSNTESSDLDTSTYDGRSSWNWFFLEK